MHSWQFDEVSWLYLAAVAVTLVVALEARRMRPARGASEFALLSFSISLWCLGYFLGFFNSALYWKLIFLRVEYAGILSSSYFWLIFIGTYVDNELLRRRGARVLLAVVPVLCFILILTVTQQHFFYSAYGVRNVGNFVTLYKHYSVGFYVQAVYAYFLVIGGTLLLLHSVYQMPERFRRQSVFIGVAMAVILVPNFLYVTGTGVFGIYDPTPISFAVAGILFSFMMVKFRFLDVVPIAYRQVFRSVNSGILIIDMRGLILELNPAAEKIISGTSRASLGKRLSDVFPECAEGVAELMKPGGKTELQLEKGKRIYSLSLSPFTGGDGERLGGIVMLYDITELRNALDEIDTFAHSVAHDLKTPLSLLSGFSDLLSSETLSQPERDEAVEVIRVYSNKMASIVDELLTLARVRRDHNIAFAPVEMGPVVKSALLRLERFAQEKKSRIYLPDSLPSTFGYAPWIEEIWVNYVSNALKYGGPSPNIYIGSEDMGSMVKFWVKDNGPGISRTEQGKLFKEFSRVDARSGESGHGLGLFIVSRIVSKLGGEAGVESEPGSGAKFYFTLPKSPGESGPKDD